MYRFEPGAAYRFVPCLTGRYSFVAIASERKVDRRGVEFVMPNNIIRGFPAVMDGREMVRVQVDGLDYCASAAAPLVLSATYDLLEQFVSARTRRA